MKIEKYSMGVGDRFGRQSSAQLTAFLKAKEQGIDVVPVWNKSNREHQIIGTLPNNVRTAAEKAVSELGWTGSYYVDADHINEKNVDRFIAASDFFTLDVADYIGTSASQSYVADFVKKHSRFTSPFKVEGIEGELCVTKDEMAAIADKYLYAAQQAGVIYRKIVSEKGADNFITEVSMDETDRPQTPIEMLFILAAISDEGIPAQTIAPRFSGRFNKGVDYVGDVDCFEREFNDDLAIIRYAVNEFELPDNLKLSIHSGSDKFSIYEPVKKAIAKFNAGLHIKTAGTTWLEEVIGLAESGGEGLVIAVEIYELSRDHIQEICRPYASVIDINHSKLPDIQTVRNWTGEEYAAALRHDESCPQYNPNLRQLLHVGYKIAAQMGDKYLNALEHYTEAIARNVTGNIYERHLLRIFNS